MLDDKPMQRVIDPSIIRTDLHDVYRSERSDKERHYELEVRQFSASRVCS